MSRSDCRSSTSGWRTRRTSTRPTPSSSACSSSGSWPGGTGSGSCSARRPTAAPRRSCSSRSRSSSRTARRRSRRATGCPRRRSSGSAVPTGPTAANGPWPRAHPDGGPQGVTPAAATPMAAREPGRRAEPAGGRQRDAEQAGAHRLRRRESSGPGRLPVPRRARTAWPGGRPGELRRGKPGPGRVGDPHRSAHCATRRAPAVPARPAARRARRLRRTRRLPRSGRLRHGPRKRRTPGGAEPGARRGRHGTDDVPVVTGVPVGRPTRCRNRNSTSSRRSGGPSRTVPRPSTPRRRSLTRTSAAGPPTATSARTATLPGQAPTRATRRLPGQRGRGSQRSYEENGSYGNEAAFGNNGISDDSYQNGESASAAISRGCRAASVRPISHRSFALPGGGGRFAGAGGGSPGYSGIADRHAQHPVRHAARLAARPVTDATGRRGLSRWKPAIGTQSISLIGSLMT